MISSAHSEVGHLPGATPYSKTLSDSLQAALVAKGTDYQPRTEHLLDHKQPKFINRLILENSPYLLQHAHNPVDWFPWGDEAFEKARRENKPIFLSIGYSTCHWCHVMERESFDNIEIARFMNESFVCIKVDRERHPEVDEVYMTAVMIIAGHGGWPMSTFLTPEGKPFWGGTYFSPATFTHLLKQVVALWQDQPSKLIAQADSIATIVKEMTAASGKAHFVHEKAISNVVSEILSRHDDFLGGFGQAPKFPNETWLLLLLMENAHRNNEAALTAVETSLRAMAQGGIYDQIGGGFHRYATDDHWLTPHFEKMLYNQAHIARVYLVAYQLTGKAFYATIARQTLDYVLREMTSAQGGFYSATDADSEGHEGTFFLWTPSQIRAVLDKEEAQLALSLYDITKAGHFEGKNILHLPLALEQYSDKYEIPLTQLTKNIDTLREKLHRARDKRVPPLRDDKILTAWNGMMITTLAQAADILGEPDYLMAAQRATNLIWSQLRKGTGELWRVYLNGHASVPAPQEDYAYYAEALLSLYDATGQSLWLERAKEIVDGMLGHFWDQAQGGFFMNRKDDTILIINPKSLVDNVIPSGNAVAVRVLAMLAARTGIIAYRNQVHATLNAFSKTIMEQPIRYTYLLLATDELFHDEIGMRRYSAQGAVKATAKLVSHNKNNTWLVITLNIREGWHINDNKTLQKELTPTVVQLEPSQQDWQLGAVHYPKPEYQSLSWQQSKLALYQGTVHLRSQLKSLVTTAQSTVVPVRLKFQACHDNLCLPPTEMVFKIALPQ